ncbi:hypothetical protein LTSEINV_3039, partial [Salmonella enterica subsp. enterica serovar Inverness str. R8-3668]
MTECPRTGYTRNFLCPDDVIRISAPLWYPVIALHDARARALKPCIVI